MFIKYNIVIEITVLYAQKLLDYRLSLMNVITETCHVHYMDKFIRFYYVNYNNKYMNAVF